MIYSRMIKVLRKQTSLGIALHLTIQVLCFQFQLFFSSFQFLIRCLFQVHCYTSLVNQKSLSLYIFINIYKHCPVTYKAIVSLGMPSPTTCSMIFLVQKIWLTRTVCVTYDSYFLESPFCFFSSQFLDVQGGGGQLGQDVYTKSIRVQPIWFILLKRNSG